MAPLAAARRAMELPAHVAAFAGDEIMRAEQIEPGSGMVERFLNVFRGLCKTDAACKKDDTEAQAQRPTQGTMHPSADA